MSLDGALFDPARHQALADIPWDAGRVCAAIAAIIEDVERQRDTDGQWPVHPDDADSPADTVKPPPLTPLYHGTVGVRWALRYLESLGFASRQPPLSADLPELIKRKGLEAMRKEIAVCTSRAIVFLLQNRDD